MSGCAHPTYQYGIPDRKVKFEPGTQTQFCVGGEHPHLDRMEGIVQYPRREVRKWFRKEGEPEIPEEESRSLAVQKAHEFLVLNEMPDVRIDIREYDPSEQWRRLRANPHVSPFWKYSTGTLRHVEYCLLPGRVFHQDSFNIYTNTLSLNSTRPPNALYAAAQAKYLHSRRYPGAFDGACYLPIVPLYRDIEVADDVLSYVHAKEEWEFEKTMYPQIYGNIGGDAIGQATSLIPGFAYVPFYVKPALKLGGNIAGRATGKWTADQREKERDP